MNPWAEHLKAALEREYGSKPRVATLAGVDETGRPRARSIVVRRVEDDGTVWVASDARSDKGTQFRQHPGAEVVFWLAGLRQQFRLAGWTSVAPLDDPRRATLWREMSDSARALFFWPNPGIPRDPEGARFPERVAADAPLPEAFDLLILTPDRVERLDLTEHPHQRTRWDLGSDWTPQSLNP